ncbi:MAG: phosphate signaling complex protein PhoU [Ruminococcus sp.]|nr:phosphate signaling complex protein PhoU [Ruminococcus sp.]
MREYFDTELANLNNQLIGMGTLVENAIKNTIDIIVSGNTDGLEKARENEELINSAEKKIQNHCLRLLLHQAPVAQDLRYVSSALKMITDLERIGDQAIDIAEMAQYIKNQSNMVHMTHIAEMASQASEMVTMAIDAFVKKDIELAKTVSRRDDVIDELFDRVKAETVEIIHNNKELGTEAIDLMMIAKYLERIGDHAVNVAEWVSFSITGSRDF